MNQVEQQALNNKMMISDKEAQMRRLAGSVVAAITTFLYFYLGPLNLSPWQWCSLVAVSVGLFRTGTQKE
jgi:hypothetical protein